ncbi:hypothetical protein BYT27DRAFT_7227989 [Phlegmacium glaucopus]|nr:hypothetical protein BYT27DRAFT_7227989 [Phlegmacium glaucopus]
MPVSDAILTQILAQLEAIQLSQQTLQANPPKGSNPIPSLRIASAPPTVNPISRPGVMTDKEREKLLYPGRVNLTTYSDQHGITPHPLKWGAEDPIVRGPVICSRLPSSIKHRNAIALSIAMGSLSPTHKPDYSHTEPPVSITPNPAWYDPTKIVSFDPWGHSVPSVFRAEIEEMGLDARPSIAVTKAHLKMSELDDAARKGDITVDGHIVLKSEISVVEVTVSKATVEPVWYLPGVAERFGISESLLGRALFEDTGGMYPELITRSDVKVFLPPIGCLTVYIFGNPAFMSDASKDLTLRVHDECNGSDVFGSDICTCKPYLTYAMKECIRTAQKEGVGLVVYFRRIYNLRKRGGDSADKYFKSTDMIAGVKDMRFQALMPDIVHWLGITKIDNMVSMSDMKYDAIVKSGILIKKRYDLPDHLIPPDSRVEIDAKIAAGYFSSGKQITEADLFKTVGRTWEETEH